jgi:hypothetical protein
MSQYWNSKGKSGPDQIICDACGEKGHPASECTVPGKGKNKGKKSDTMMAYLKGKAGSKGDKKGKPRVLEPRECLTYSGPQITDPNVYMTPVNDFNHDQIANHPHPQSMGHTHPEVIAKG